MTNRHLEARKERYFTLSARLAQVGRKQLDSLLGEASQAQGWGGTHTIAMDSSKVFVKRIPVTQLEYDNMFSTENLYGMPTFYNYGVGSAGFGVFRELAAHVKTTNWVLEGSLPNFPIMYHYRIVSVSRTRPEMNAENHKGYIDYWNGDENIDRYIRERHAAPFELVLFLEHFPHVLHHWLAKNMDKSGIVIREMRRTTAFLRERGMVHFDAHFANIVVDGDIPYLTDFGLVLDKGFELTAPEREFCKRHGDYDDAEFPLCLGAYLATIYWHLPDGAKKKVTRKYGIAEDIAYADLVSLLLDNLEEIHSGRLMKLDDAYVAEVIRHRELILTMQKFYTGMRGSSRKDTPYRHTKIKRLLKEAE